MATLPIFNCFGKVGLDDLQKAWEDRKKANPELSDKEIARDILKDEHKKLFDGLNDIRSGINKNSKSKLSVEKYPTTIADNTEKIKSLNEDYNNRIQQEKQNILSQQKTEQNAVQEQSASSVLQHPQEPTGEGRGGRERVESSKQGNETAGTQQPIPKEKNISESKEEKGVNDLADIHAEYPPTQLSHGGTERLRTEFGGEETPPKERESFLKWEKEADDAIENGYDVKGLLNKMENELYSPSPKEQFILTKYADLLAQQLRDIGKDKSKTIDSPEFDDKLREIERVEKLSDLAGSRGGKELVARKFKTVNNDSLVGFLLQEKELNKGADLTSQQKTTAINEYENIKAANEEWQKKYDDLQAQYSKLLAEREVKKQAAETKRNIKKTHDDFIKERQSILDAAREKIKKARESAQDEKISGIGGRTKLDDLITIAPDVAKLVKSYVEEGVTKLDDIIKGIHAQFKDDIPELSEKDIHNVIAGDYNEKKGKTRNQVMEQSQNLKLQAQAINKLEKALNGEALTEKQKIKKNQEIAEFKKQLGLDKVEQLEALRKRNETETQKIQEQIKKGDFAKPEKSPILSDAELKKNFPDLYKAALESKTKLVQAKNERRFRMALQNFENMSDREKAVKNFVRYTNVPRTLMSSMDYSAPLRQGIVALISHPFMGAKALRTMFEHGWSQEAFDRYYHDMKETPRWQLMQDSKLAITDPHSLHLNAQEEAFLGGNVAEQIPIIGRGVKASERAYVSFLNKMRIDLFNRFADRAEEQGKTFQNSPELYKSIASFVNSATGRGSMAFLESSSPMFNTLLFSPRLIASRLNMLGLTDIPNLLWRGLTLGKHGIDYGFYTKMPKELRVVAMGDMLKTISTFLTVAALAKYGFGAQVETDPRSSDFGKIRSGNTRWDFFGGFQPYMRLIAQLAYGQSKSTNTGKIYELNGEGAFGRNRWDDILSFGRGKLAPIPSVLADWANSWRGMGGEKLTLATELENHLMPLIATDVYSAMQDQGIKALFTVGVPSTFGVGVQTYAPKPPKVTPIHLQQRQERQSIQRQQRQER